MVSWPSSLPQPQLGGYGLDVQDVTIRTDMDGGTARVRRRSTSIPDHVSLRFLFDSTQLATFRAFWETDFLYGSAWVSIPIKDGRTPGLASKECRPVPASYKAVPISSSHWAVEFSVEVRNA